MLQRELAVLTASRGWSTRKLEQEVKHRQDSTGKSGKRKDANLQSVENKLSDHLGSQVIIDWDGVRGKLEIDWSNIDILDGLLEKMGFKYE